MNVLIIYLILGSRISKMQPKISYTCPGPVHMQKNCKNVCKIHVIYRFICFWSQEFQKCNQKFCIINQLIKKLSFIESIQFFIINSFFDSSAILFKHSFLIIVYTSPFYLQTLKKIACSLFSYFKCLNN